MNQQYVHKNMIRVIEFTIKEMPGINHVMSRPYTMAASSSTLDGVQMATEAFLNTGDESGYVNKIVNSGFMGVSGTPAEVIAIPNGWENNRISFKLVFELESDFSNRKTYDIEGYGESLDISMDIGTVSFDPEMILYIDHISAYRHTPAGMVVEDLNYVAHVAQFDPYGHEDHSIMPDHQVARVTDINSTANLMGTFSGYHDSHLIDTRHALGRNCAVAKLEDMLIPDYVTGMLKHWINSSITKNQDGMHDSLISHADMAMVSENIQMVEGLMPLNLERNRVNNLNTITLKSLIDSLGVSFDIIQYIPYKHVPFRSYDNATVFDTPENVENWVGATLNAEIAHSIGNQLPALIMRYGLLGAEIGGHILANNKDHIGAYVANPIPARPEINHAVAVNLIRSYLINNLLPTVSKGGEIQFEFKVSINSSDLTHIKVRLYSDNIEVPYVLPSYGLSLGSSVRLDDTHTFNTLSSHANQLYETIMDVGVEQSLGSNTYEPEKKLQVAMRANGAYGNPRWNTSEQTSWEHENHETESYPDDSTTGVINQDDGIFVR